MKHRLLLSALLLCACGDDDDDARDQVDGGHVDAGGIDAGPAFTLPVYRVGPRVASAGFFTAEASGTLSVPKAIEDGDFAGWTVSGWAGGENVVFSNPRDEGDDRVVDFTASVSHVAANPIAARELFFAGSVADGVVLTTTPDDDGKLHFSLASTALQALSLAPLRASDAPVEEVYYSGLRTGDQPAVDAKVAAVVTALAGHDGVGITQRGQARPGTPVGDAVEVALTSGQAPTLLNAPSLSSDRLGRARTGGAGKLAVWSEGTGYLVHLPVDGDLSFFLYSLFAIEDDTKIYLRFQAADGRLAPLSTAFVGADSPADVPAAPTLVEDASGLRACGGELGDQALFQAAGTEIAISRVARPFGADGCAVLPPAEYPLDLLQVNALALSPAGAIGPPSDTVFVGDRKPCSGG